MEAFSTWDVYENILDLDGLKCELKSLYAADIPKQSSSIQEVAEIVRKLELNQTLAEVTKLLYLLLTIPATSASYDRSSSSLKRVNDMRCSQSEEQSNDKELLKKMKVGCGADIFYNKMNDEFAKKKRRIELINK